MINLLKKTEMSQTFTFHTPTKNIFFCTFEEHLARSETMHNAHILG